MVKRYNGGVKITINNTVDIDRITAYSISKAAETENFQKYDGSTFSRLKGYRSNISVSTGWMTEEEMKQITAVLSRHRITITDTDKNFGEDGADFYVTSISKPLVKADIYGKFYSVSFAATAVELTDSSGYL